MDFHQQMRNDNETKAKTVFHISLLLLIEDESEDVEIINVENE